MTTLSVCWAGLEPVPGEWLVSSSGRKAYHVERVVHLHRAMSSPRPRLVLTVSGHPVSSVPAGAMVHPWAATSPPDPAAPQAVRIRSGGPTAVMRGAWQQTPGGPRIVGWRGLCALRRMAECDGSGITERHILAADLLRYYADLAVIGRGGVIELDRVRVMVSQCGRVPGVTAVEQVNAAAIVRRLLGRFSPENLGLLTGVVLENLSTSTWLARHGVAATGYQRAVVVGRLLALLDELADDLKGDIVAGERGGWLLATI